MSVKIYLRSRSTDKWLSTYEGTDEDPTPLDWDNNRVDARSWEEDLDTAYILLSRYPDLKLVVVRTVKRRVVWGKTFPFDGSMVLLGEALPVDARVEVRLAKGKS